VVARARRDGVLVPRAGRDGAQWLLDATAPEGALLVTSLCTALVVFSVAHVVDLRARAWVIGGWSFAVVAAVSALVAVPLCVKRK